MRACWLKWVGRDWSISADYIWLNYSDANRCSIVLLLHGYIVRLFRFVVIALCRIVDIA